MFQVSAGIVVSGAVSSPVEQPQSMPEVRAKTKSSVPAKRERAVAAERSFCIVQSP